MADVAAIKDGHLWWYCPGCEILHGVVVEKNQKIDPWSWNRSLDKPTLSPSVLCQGVSKCHIYMHDGQLQFLSDCSHEFAGKTIQMEAVAPRIDW